MNLRDDLTWFNLYELIRMSFGFSADKDSFAASLLSLMLQNYEDVVYRGRDELRKLIDGKRALVVGAAPECTYLNHFINNYDVVIAADGALRCCFDKEVIPDIVVSDLDGLSVSDLISFNGVMVIHAHGDNTDRINNYVPILKERGKLIVGTHQSSTPYVMLDVFGGFTDGDRAAYLANYFNAREIGLVGFNFSGVIGKYSKPYLLNDARTWIIKRKKLYWARRLISLLRVSSDAVVKCYYCKGYSGV